MYSLVSNSLTIRHMSCGKAIFIDFAEMFFMNKGSIIKVGVTNRAYKNKI